MFYKQEGGAALEAAIILPIILFIALGLIFFPLTSLLSNIVLTDAVREAARHVAVYNDEEGAIDLVEQIISESNLDIHNLQPLEFDYTVGDGDYVTVRIVYRQPTIFPQVPVLIGGEAMDDHVVLSSSATFKKEW